ncbi:MAG: arsenite methyltransferase [Candidatus Omnitrophica bacterium]|nr:arsenite methyltransferase [Candidatus Omnitrophota bacterium]
MKESDVKKTVREGYGKIATPGQWGAPTTNCCGTGSHAEDVSKLMGYSEEELATLPEGANLGLGCGNPVALASIKEGETVLDLGSGGGIDCFLASKKVGPNGKVIGVDMTPEMLARARENAHKAGITNVEFREGEIETLPVEDNSVDCIISNCVINLVPDKLKAFAETFRVLKPGGRLMVSDIVLTKELPGKVKESMDAYVGCVSGAVLKQDYLKAMQDAGLTNVRVQSETSFEVSSGCCGAPDDTTQIIAKNAGLTPEQVREIAPAVKSIKVTAIKPKP